MSKKIRAGFLIEKTAWDAFGRSVGIGNRSKAINGFIEETTLNTGESLPQLSSAEVTAALLFAEKRGAEISRNTMMVLLRTFQEGGFKKGGR